jgi:DNA-binding MarR family transcriptional regulator
MHQMTQTPPLLLTTMSNTPPPASAPVPSPSLNDLSRSLAVARRIARRAMLPHNSITPVQTLVMLGLAKDGIRLSDLALALGNTTAAITGTADTLENLGLAERVRSRRNRTEIRLHITHAGRAALNS